MSYVGKAYSFLTVKSVNDERRIVTGIASTPKVDRVSDIVEPMGAQFKTPMPLLLYHNSQKPVGTMDFAKPTKTGIPFEASLPLVSEPGVVQERVNEALHSLKYKLIGCVSIGFRALRDGIELLEGGGLRFKAWEWMELSLVTVPANPDAVIDGFKSMDPATIKRILGDESEDDAARAALIAEIKSADEAARRAVSGNSARGHVVRLDSASVAAPGVPGQKTTRKGVVYL